MWAAIGVLTKQMEEIRELVVRLTVKRLLEAASEGGIQLKLDFQRGDAK